MIMNDKLEITLNESFTTYFYKLTQKLTEELKQNMWSRLATRIKNEELVLTPKF
jgi:hypothetical protein